MRKASILLSMLFLLGAQAFSGELDITKGFFKVPWGTSPEQALKLLNLDKSKIEKVKYGYSDQCIRFSKDGVRSQLFFYKGRFNSFTRSYDMGQIPDAKTENWTKIFSKKFEEEFKGIDKTKIGFSVSPMKTTVTIGGASKGTDVTIMLSVTNLGLEKEAKTSEEEAKKEKKEKSVNKAISSILNF